MARPSKYSETVARRICKAIEQGATYKLAAKAGGVSYETFNRWRKNKEDFGKKVDEAEWAAAQKWFNCIDEAAQNGDWRAAKWRIESRYPNQYGPSQQSKSDGKGDNTCQPVTTYLPENGRKREAEG